MEDGGDVSGHSPQKREEGGVIAFHHHHVHHYPHLPPFHRLERLRCFHLVFLRTSGREKWPAPLWLGQNNGKGKIKGKPVEDVDMFFTKVVVNGNFKAGK